MAAARRHAGCVFCEHSELEGLTRGESPRNGPLATVLLVTGDVVKGQLVTPAD